MPQKVRALSPKALKELGTDPRKTRSILSSNFYGWFDHPEKGVYTISDLGNKELCEYPELSGYFSKEIVQSLPPNNITS
jgi:hypothetical protein